MRDELVWGDILGQVDDVRVVGEDQNLRAPGELGQDGERGTGAVVVELDQYVIDNQRQGLVAEKERFDSGEPQSQVKLVGRAVAHPIESDHLESAGADAFQNGLVGLVVVHAQVRKRFEGQLGE